jgi:hypothetical protein
VSWKSDIARRPVLASLAGLLGIAAAGGLVYEGTHLFGRRYPRTKFDDLLDQLSDRESAIKLGHAAIAETSPFDAKAAAEVLRTGAGRGSVDQAVDTDITQGRLMAVQGWVLPASLVLVASIAAQISEKNG